jgi:hypothetical protein
MLINVAMVFKKFTFEIVMTPLTGIIRIKE